MPISLSVARLNLEIGDCLMGQKDQFAAADADLRDLFGLLGFTKASKGNLEFPETAGPVIHDAIWGLRPDVAHRYKPLLDYILTKIRFMNIVAVEIKSRYERLQFPFDAWCCKIAKVTPLDIFQAGGLSPRFATELCFDKDDRWPLPMRFIFATYARGVLELPIGQDDEDEEVAPVEAPAATKGPKIGNMGATFGDKTYYFLVPKGTTVYCPDGDLTGELAFPYIIGFQNIWFVRQAGSIKKVLWKRGVDSSQLPTPHNTWARLEALGRLGETLAAINARSPSPLMMLT